MTPNATASCCSPARNSASSTRRLFISETGYAKLDIALARGKKEYDKRESIKEKDLRRYSVE